LNPNLEPTNQNFASVDAEELDDFERTESIGGFEYSGPEITDALDSFPPSKVIDLTANQVDVDDVTKGIKLQFTAPGDDFDVGKGKIKLLKRNDRVMFNFSKNYLFSFSLTRNLICISELILFLSIIFYYIFGQH